MAIDQPGTTGTPDADEDEPDDIVMSVRDARVSFDMARGQAWVLNDVDLDVRRNEIGRASCRERVCYVV